MNFLRWVTLSKSLLAANTEVRPDASDIREIELESFKPTKFETINLSGKKVHSIKKPKDKRDEREAELLYQDTSSHKSRLNNALTMSSEDNNNTFPQSVDYNEKIMNSLVYSHLRTFKNKLIEEIGSGDDPVDINEFLQLHDRLQTQVLQNALKCSSIYNIINEDLEYQLLTRFEQDKLEYMQKYYQQLESSPQQAIAKFKVNVERHGNEWVEKNSVGIELEIPALKYMEVDLEKMNIISPDIGIDLGTTNSYCSVFIKDETFMIPDRVNQELCTPSCVLIKEGGEIVVGQVAKEEAVLYPGRAIFDAKRLIGRKFNEEDVTRDIKLWPFQVIDHKNRPKISVGVDTYFPEQILAEILKKLKQDAERYLKCEVKNAVITVPAYFSDSQKMATKDAGLVAGLNVLSIINEPTAAAIAYSLSYTDDKKRHVLVYDLGGGTFDVSVLKIKKGDIQVLAVGGNNHLGGEDFDNKLLNYCLEKFFETTQVNLREGQKDIVNGRLRRIRNICRQQKVNLSQITETNIFAREIWRKLELNLDLNVNITRDTFNELNQSSFEETIDIVKTTIQEAKLTLDQIDDIVLVGGSSKIPKIQEMLQNLFPNKTLNMPLNINEFVSRGAAFYAAILSGNRTNGFEKIKLSDVAPFSIGIEAIGHRFFQTINKNSTLPVKETYPIFTSENNQTEIEISVFESEDSTLSNKNLLGKFTLKGIPLAPTGKEAIMVTIDVNIEGILSVSAVSMSTGGSKNVKIESVRTNLTVEEKWNLKLAYDLKIFC